MQRIKTATAVTARPAYDETGTPGYFTNGDAVAGLPATVVGKDWLNQVQEELIHVITAAGLTPSATDDAQLEQAIATIITDAIAPTASETTAGIAKLATQALVDAGVDDVTTVTPLKLAAAVRGVVRGYTAQQYAVPVVLTGQAGNVQLDAEIHQDVEITATGELHILTPQNAALGMYINITLHAASALAVTWDSAFVPQRLLALPTACVAGKALVAQFRYCTTSVGPRWLLIGVAEEG